MACMANITSQKAGFLGSQCQQMLGLRPPEPPQGALPLEPRWGLTQPPDPRRDWLPPIIYKLPASTKENKNPANDNNNNDNNIALIAHFITAVISMYFTKESDYK